MNKKETLEEVKPPIGKFIIDNAVSIQGTDGAYYHYSEVCKLLRLQQQQDKKMYSEEEVRDAYRWGTLVNQGTKEHFNEFINNLNNK
jgi:predicted S18 family serine protease